MPYNLRSNAPGSHRAGNRIMGTQFRQLVRQISVRTASVGLAASLGMVACATPRIAQVSVAETDLHLKSVLGLDTCRDALARGASGDAPGLDPGSIRLTNWNVEKKADPSWRSDLDRLSPGADLILLQEASLREDTINELDATLFWSFAPGYRSNEQVSGVMTLSTVNPVTRCSLVSMEPFLRTPKATNITQFSLKGRDETLVVVNMHAVNFSFGLRSFKEQFEEVRQSLARHDGPVVLSGDLNTWRAGRQAVVDELAEDLGLVAINFDEDYRVSRFGRQLDHILVRGLQPVNATTYDVSTSDHNPMSVDLRFPSRTLALTAAE